MALNLEYYETSSEIQWNPSRILQWNQYSGLILVLQISIGEDELQKFK